jgi:hypothetical protein
MSEIEQQLAGLCQQAEQARQRWAVATSQQATAEHEIQEVLIALKAEFGVETIEAAQALLATLQEKSQQEIMNVQAALAAAQGGQQ